MSDEQISMEHMNRMIELFRYNLETHVKHCHLCIPNRWHCPDAIEIQRSQIHWKLRLSKMTKPQEEQK